MDGWMVPYGCQAKLLTNISSPHEVDMMNMLPAYIAGRHSFISIYLCFCPPDESNLNIPSAFISSSPPTEK